MDTAFLIAQLLFILLPQQETQDLQPPEDRPYVVRFVFVDTHDIFDEQNLDTFLHKAANLLHYKSRDYIIQRELLLRPGDRYDASLAAETERNLRSLRFIAEAQVLPLFHPDGSVDLYFITRDKFTLRVGGGLSFTGGQSKINAQLRETNFLGLGLALTSSFVYREDNQIFRFGYADPRFFSTRYRVSANAAISDFGHRIAMDVVRPYFSLDTRWSWGANALRTETAEDYFFNGEEVNRIPIHITSTSGFVSHAWGTRMSKLKLRSSLYHERRNFSDPDEEDVVAGFEIDIPVDRTVTGISLSPRYEWISKFVKMKELDAIDYVEDVALGVRMRLSIAAEYWHGSGIHGFRIPLSGSVIAATRPFDDQLITAAIEGGVRLAEDGDEAWYFSGFYHHYYQGLPWQTLALSVAFDVGREDVGLPVQYTLGEDSGLRGYDARQFAGTHRLRINFENRIYTPLELFSFRLGFVAFLDAGYAWSGDRFSLHDLRSSAGFGIRIGSARLLKRSVVRVDIAFPLHDDGKETVTISFSTGQIFGLFSNEGALDAKF